MARKRPRPSEGSRYTACPACGQTIAFLLLNAHLDACTAPTDAQSGSRQEPDGSCALVAPAAPTTKVPHVLAAGRTPVAFARQDGRKMPLTDEQLAALTPCEVRLPCCMHLPWICHGVHSLYLDRMNPCSWSRVSSSTLLPGRSTVQDVLAAFEPLGQNIHWHGCKSQLQVWPSRRLYATVCRQIWRRSCCMTCCSGRSDTFAASGSCSVNDMTRRAQAPISICEKQRY